MKFLASILILFTCALPACVASDGDEAQLSIPISTTTADGVYTLSGPLFIYGPGNRTTNIDLASAPDTIDLRLRPGNYTIELGDWELQLDGVPVDARLISANPARVRLGPGEQVELSFRFVTGRIMIDFTVDASARWFMGTFAPGLPGGVTQGTVPAAGILHDNGQARIDFLLIGHDLELVAEGQGVRDWRIKGAQLELSSFAVELGPLSLAYSGQDAYIQARPVDGEILVGVQITNAAGDAMFSFDTRTRSLMSDAGGPILAPFETPPLEISPSGAALYDLEGNFADGRSTWEYGELN